MNTEVDQLHLNTIVNSIHEIEGYTEGMNYNDFSREEETQAIVARNLQVIAEASRQLSTEFKTFYNDIDFRVLENLAYASYNVEVEHGFQVIWSIIENDLPIFRDTILTISSEMNSTQRDDDAMTGPTDANEWVLD